MLGFLKKKKTEKENKESVVVTTATFKSVVNDTPPEYNPWDASEGNADNEYANAVFISIHVQPMPFPDTADVYSRYVSYDLGIHDPIKKLLSSPQSSIHAHIMRTHSVSLKPKTSIGVV